MEIASDFNFDFPPIIELQTYSRCNAMCTICPYEAIEVKHGISKMDDILLQRLLNEINLHSHKVKTVIPYLNNEPFLDNRLIPVLQSLKKDGLKTEISTNFSGLTKLKIEQIVEENLIDDFRISFFGGNKKTYSEIMPGLNFEQIVEKIDFFITAAKGKKILENTSLVLVLNPKLNIQNETRDLKMLFPELKIRFFGYLDRAGNNSQKNNILKEFNDLKLSGCSLNRPFERCCIDTKGNVILCSQDWNKDVILGNVTNSTIAEVWNSVPFKEARDKILGITHSDSKFICYHCKLAEFKTLSHGNILNFEGDRYVNRDDVKLINPDSI